MKRIEYSDGSHELIDDYDLQPEDVYYDEICRMAYYKGNPVDYIMDDTYEEDYDS